MIAETLTFLGSCGALAAGWHLGPALLRRREVRGLAERCADTRTLVLSYDDGPGPDLTPRLLDLLATRGVRATFFPAGFRTSAEPALVERIAAAGHEIGCHGDRHLHAWRVGPRRAVRDIARGYQALARWVPPDGIYRPPYGKMTPVTRAHLRRRGAPLGWWTIASGDLGRTPAEPDLAAERAARAGGGVVLLHDLDCGEEHALFVLECTDRLLDLAAGEGWRVSTLGEVAGCARADRPPLRLASPEHEDDEIETRHAA